MSVEFSIVIPAYNEEDLLEKTLISVKEAIQYVNLDSEVIVVDNNSSDRTPEIASQHGVKVVFEPVNQISRARNTGAKNAEGKYLVFLDADTLLPGDLLKKAIENLQSGTICGGGSVVHLDKEITGIAAKLINLWNKFSYERKIAAGSFIYCLHEGFDAVEGFNEHIYASEEIWFSKNLKRWGKKKGMSFQVIREYPVITSSRKMEWYSTSELLFRCFLPAIFPFGLYSKSLCGAWYKRPVKSPNTER